MVVMMYVDAAVDPGRPRLRLPRSQVSAYPSCTVPRSLVLYRPRLRSMAAYPAPSVLSGSSICEGSMRCASEREHGCNGAAWRVLLGFPTHGPGLAAGRRGRSVLPAARSTSLGSSLGTLFAADSLPNLVVGSTVEFERCGLQHVSGGCCELVSVPKATVPPKTCHGNRLRGTNNEREGSGASSSAFIIQGGAE